MDTIYQNFSKDLYEYFWNDTVINANVILKDIQHAEDITSETLMLLIIKLEQYDLLSRFANEDGTLKKDEKGQIPEDKEGRSLQGLILTVVRRASISFIKKQRKTYLVFDFSPFERVSSAEEKNIFDARRDFVGANIKQISNEILSPQQQRVFSLRYFGKRKLKEIGRELNISTSTVKKHWKLIIKAFKEWFKKESDNPRRNF